MDEGPRIYEGRVGRHLLEEVPDGILVWLRVEISQQHLCSDVIMVDIRSEQSV